MRFEPGSEEASWYKTHELHQMWKGTQYQDVKGDPNKKGPLLDRTFGPAPLSPSIYSPCVWPTGKQVLAAAVREDVKLLAWNSPREAKVSDGGTAATEDTVLVPKTWNREAGYVIVARKIGSSGKVEGEKIFMRERHEGIRKMRNAFMQEVGPLSRVSVNFRFGLLSPGRCQVDWRMSSSVEQDGWQVPEGKALEETAGVIAATMRKMRWPQDYTPTKAEADAWKQMTAKYLAGVIPYGRYNMPSDEKHAHQIYVNWCEACEERLNAERKAAARFRDGQDKPADGGGQRSGSGSGGGKGKASSGSGAVPKKKKRNH